MADTSVTDVYANSTFRVEVVKVRMRPSARLQDATTQKTGIITFSPEWA
jgi:hypothetical protein